MDPLITNGIDPGLLRVLDKHGQEREGASRRKRLPAPEKTNTDGEADENNEENEAEMEPGTPKHTLDDLA